MADIEDLAQNALENRALPLCMSSLMRTYGRSRTAYPHTADRWWIASVLHSLRASEMDTTSVTRYLLHHSPSSKYAEQYGEVGRWGDARFEASHRKHATGRNQLLLSTMNRQESGDASFAKTTCAPSCSTMSVHGSNGVFRCPYRVGFDRARLEAQLVESGVESAAERTAILNTQDVKSQCKMQLEYSRPAATRGEPVFTASTADVDIMHPFVYYHLAADHLHRARQRRARTPHTTTTTTTTIDDHEMK
jgi:hypothetical protein